MQLYPIFFFFFFNDTATTEIYTLSLHDALPIYVGSGFGASLVTGSVSESFASPGIQTSSHISQSASDRKSTRLNSSHLVISYAVFCLKKKKMKDIEIR